MILFTADWHIKLGQKNVPKDWAKARYYEFFKQVHAIECDMHIIGGDLFDRLPTLEEEELYYDFLVGVKVPTIIFPGNHEATTKYASFFKHLKKVTKAVNPLVTIIDISYVDPDFGFSILPYNELHRKGSIEHFDTSKPLFTHVRGAIPPHVTPEVDLDRFEDFPVVFAGDLHAHSNTQRNIVYPGSPMTTSFHRARVDTGYLLINEGTWDWLWEPFNLPQLIRRTVSDPKDMIPGEIDHVIYELEGDLGDLANAEANELLDKKVVKRSTEATLILDNNMSIGEELVEYLSYILQIEESKIPSVVGLYNDIAKNVEVE